MGDLIQKSKMFCRLGRICELGLIILTCSAASAATKSQAIASCAAYLTGSDVIKASGPVRSEITSLMDRYDELGAGIGWGKGSHQILLNVTANKYEINRNSLPSVPKLNEVSSLHFVTALRGKLKVPLNGFDTEWGIRTFKVIAKARRSGGLSYELSSDVDKDSAEAHLFLYLMALNAVPYANAFELTIQADKWNTNPDVFQRVKELILEGESQNAIGDQIASPAVRVLKKSPIFKSMATDILQFNADKIMRDPDKADAFMITYRFLLNDRPILN